MGASVQAGGGFVRSFVCSFVCYNGPERAATETAE
jgi:hypothetical protein